MEGDVNYLEIKGGHVSPRIGQIKAVHTRSALPIGITYIGINSNKFRIMWNFAGMLNSKRHNIRDLEDCLSKFRIECV